MKTPFFSLGASLWIGLFIFPSIYAQGCDSGWFGSSCQYKCHCTGNNCDNNGDCTGNSGCVPGWFGSQCQYVDLVFTEIASNTVVTFVDANDGTCNSRTDHQIVAVTFTRTFPFTWLRLVVETEGLSLGDIKVTFTDDTRDIGCNSKRDALVDSRTIDIYCDVSVEIKQVTVEGVAIGHLCSLYVSGGRNVALKQAATQSSMDYGKVASNAVDGNTNQNFDKGTCTHTQSTASGAMWSVQFSKRSNVNRYVIYNRDTEQIRLKGFVLTAYDQDGSETYKYTDQKRTALSVYTVTSSTISAKTVNITAKHIAEFQVPILTLCEVEIYGDTACPVVKYGRECEHECHCANNKQCLVSIGMCPNGCDVGFSGIHCDQPCTQGFYGANCQQQCSSNCAGNKCDRGTGECDQCKAGYKGDKCETPCTSTKWGPGCVNQCSGNCMNTRCDSVTGICHQCQPGKSGDFCDQPCPLTTWGSDCGETCRGSCKNQDCNAVTGICKECPDGKTGDYCGQTCASTKWGPRCINTCSVNCKNQQCDGVTGKCNECPSGKNGDQCDQDCSPTKYGSRCKGTCSKDCLDQHCSGDDGRCNECPSGKTGPQCDQDCLPTQYGSRCAKTCSKDCDSQLCTGDNGRCVNCTSGWMGDYCDQPCSPKTYGPRCINKCSSNCEDSKCDRGTGICDSCPSGKFGDQCNADCPDGTYGLGCQKNCSDTCKVSRYCDSNNGTCHNGCRDGYRGDLCDDVCDIGMYGANCSNNCSQTCNTTGLAASNTSCHHISGHCLYGCVDRYEGLSCEAEKLSASPDAPVGAIVGAILAVVVIVALIVIGVLIWRRKHNKKDGAGIFGNRKKSPKGDEKTGFMQPGNSRVDGNPYENVEIAAGTNQVKIAAPTAKAETAKAVKPDIKPKPAAKPKKGDDPATYYNTGNLGKSKSTSIPIGKLQAFVAASGKEFFKKQFESIPDNKKATTKIAQNAENKQKNRYKNICAYDHSRVCLLADKDKSLGDYINANYIEGYNGEEKFIASQGPTKINMNDFIRMLWEQKVEKVVMLTNLVEEGKMKCEKYWPDDEKQWFGDIKMVLTTTEIFADYTIRRLHLKKGSDTVQPVTHFHFTSWPDKGVPTIPWGLVDFEQRVASYPTSKPIVVHCSAGVGRTGTFIALRNVMREAEDTGYVDCFATVQNLRKDRVNMVQTAEQYEFLHRAAQVAMVCLGTTVTSADIQDRITKLESKTPTGQTLMEHEFAAICSVCADDGEADVKQEAAAADSTYVVYENSSLVANKFKDRLKNVPAKENYRAILARENDDMGDYINAVLVPSFRKLDQQILTQLPLPTTVTDFWRLVTQYKVALVVAFAMGCDEKDSSVADYLPLNKDETMSVPLFNITSGSISRGDVSEVQQVTVEAVDVDVRRKSMPVFLNGQHHLTHVKYMSPDLNPKKLLDLIKQVREHFPGPEGRVVFLCRNGATYSGLMCVLTLLLDRMDNDLRLTVPLVVGAIKSIRPQVIPTLDQYKLLYQILHMYNESNNVYSNFGEAQTPEKERRRLEEEQDKENAGIYANN